MSLKFSRKKKESNNQSITSYLKTGDLNIGKLINILRSS